MQPQPLATDRQPFILVIDSPDAPAQDVQQALSQTGYLPLGPVNTLADALALIQSPGGLLPVAALVVLDSQLPAEAGLGQHVHGQPEGRPKALDLASEHLHIGKALQSLAGLPVLYLAEDIPEPLVEHLALSEAQGFISRPVRPRVLHVMIEMALQSCRDIRACKQDRQQLHQALAEKDALLHDLHHRMRNNLQVIGALLSLQEDFFDDLSTRRALQDLRRRLETIALAHTPRYQAANSSDLDLGAYLNDLTGWLTAAPAGSSRSSNHDKLPTGALNVQTDIASLLVPAHIATPCGLIIYELLANALEHAFPNRRSGTLQVWLRQADQVVSLGVADDGVGFPDDFDYRRDSRLGLQIVQALAEYQLSGELVCYNRPGLRWEIRFNLGKLSPPPSSGKEDPAR